MIFRLLIEFKFKFLLKSGLLVFIVVGLMLIRFSCLMILFLSLLINCCFFIIEISFIDVKNNSI